MDARFAGRFPRHLSGLEASETAAVSHFTALRWQEGAYCPNCGHQTIYHFSDGENHRCSKCRKRFSYRYGTALEGSKLPVRTWIASAWLIASSPSPITSGKLASELNLSPKSCRHILSRLGCSRKGLGSASAPTCREPLQRFEDLLRDMAGVARSGERAAEAANWTPRPDARATSSEPANLRAPLSWPTTPTMRRGLARRATILGVAGRLFAANGFEQTSIRQIASEADMLPGSVYHHFATKEDILHALIRHPLQRELALVEGIVNLSIDSEMSLICIILLRCYLFMEERDAQFILHNEHRLFLKRPDFSYILQNKQARRARVLDIFEIGIADQIFRHDLNPVMMIRMVWLVLNYIPEQRSHGMVSIAEAHEDYSLGEMIDFYLRSILGMVRSPSRSGLEIPRFECERLLRPLIEATSPA